MKLNINPTTQTTIFLSVFSIFAIAFNFRTEVLVHLGMILGFALLLFGIFSAISNKKKNLHNTIITALIIFLILHPAQLETIPVLITLGIVFLAIFIKFFLEYRMAPPINPTVMAILIVWGILSLLPTQFASELFVSWWGASFRGWISLVLIALWIVFGVFKWRKFVALFSFLIALAVVFLIFADFEIFKYYFTDSTIYFLATIMLIEPKTSPILKKQQLVYGLLAAATYFILFYYKIPYFELIAIAAANLYFFFAKLIKLKQAPVAN